MSMETIPRDFSGFQDLCRRRQIIGLGVVQYCDHETAISLADRFVEKEHFFLLESATSGPGNVARYSFLGYDPLWLWECHGEQIRIKKRRLLGVDDGFDRETKTLQEKDPINAMYEDFKKLNLGSQFSRSGNIQAVDLSAIGGAVGFIGFDVSSKIEPSIGKPPEKKLGLPDLIFQIPQNFLVLDQLSKQLHIYRYLRVDGCNPDELELLYEQEMRALEMSQSALQKPHSPPTIKTLQTKIDFEKMSETFPKADFLKAADYCLQQIRDGEIFQVQIGNRLSCETQARPFDIFRHLRMINPSPYMFFYKFGRHHVVGASPEMMVNIDEGRAVHRPIAGTRKRTWNYEQDQLMKKELVGSEKERAEHIMLVDLSRNDVGRIAKAGSVTVDELMIVEEYSHVFHMVSQVSCEVHPDFSPAEVMAMSFPNGTVSGAPKVRAMELIYELEPVSREYYAGSLGVFDFSGNLKSTILIRSMHIADGVASTHASAGIVADSIPEQEWKETLNKMAACVTAIQKTV